MKETTSKKKHKINISKEKKGIYILNIKSESQNISEKIIIE